MSVVLGKRFTIHHLTDAVMDVLITQKYKALPGPTLGHADVRQ